MKYELTITKANGTRTRKNFKDEYSAKITYSVESEKNDWVYLVLTKKTLFSKKTMKKDFRPYF